MQTFHSTLTKVAFCHDHSPFPAQNGFFSFVKNMTQMRKKLPAAKVWFFHSPKSVKAPTEKLGQPSNRFSV